MHPLAGNGNPLSVGYQRVGAPSDVKATNLHSPLAEIATKVSFKE